MLFFLGDKGDTHHIHWTAWKEVCKGKEQGGLGMYTLKEMNLAFGAKLWWQFRKQDSLWSKVLSTKYCKNSHPTLIEEKLQDSTIWRRITRVSHMVEPYLRWKINSGSCNPVLDHWLYSGRIQDEQVLERLITSQIKDFTNNNQWNTHQLEQILEPEIVNEITSISLSNKEDEVGWTWNNGKEFTTKSFINMMRGGQPRDSLYSYLWKHVLPPRIAIHNWKLWKDLIPVDELLSKRMQIPLVSCCQCCRHIEDSNHVFIYGPWAHYVWDHYFSTLKIKRIQFHSPKHLYRYWITILSCKPGDLISVIPFFVNWMLWKQRNKSKHEGKQQHPANIIKAVDSLLKVFLEAGFQWRSLRRYKMVPVYWDKPPEGWIKLNTDGSLKSHIAGGGGVIRDSQGQFIKGYREHYGHISILEAEVRAIATGIALCKSLKYGRVIVEADSLIAIQFCKCNIEMPWHVKYHVQFIKETSRTMQVEFKHIWREGNQAADHMANLGQSTNGKEIMEPKDIQKELKTILVLDNNRLASLRKIVCREGDRNA